MITAPPGRPMHADILRQPGVLLGLLDRRDEFAAIGRAHVTPGPGGRVRAFGCGDGWFAARAVAGVASEAFGAPLHAGTSLQMLLDPDCRSGPEDRAVAISMSGSVDRTNEAASAQAGGCVALSNGDGGALGRVARAVASLHVPDIAPFLTGTARYTATVLGLMLLLDRAQAHGEAFRAACGSLSEGLAIAGQALGDLCAMLAGEGVAGVRVLGAGADWASADYGAAKMVKTLPCPVWAAETEEFAHSQFWSVREGELVVLLAGSAAAARLAANTAEALAAAGLRTLSIETAGAPVRAATHRLVLPAAASWLAPLVMPAPLQMLAYHLARAMGADPDASADAADPARFRAAQMLSRRCELA